MYIANSGMAGISIIRAEDSKNAIIENVLIVGATTENPPPSSFANGEGIKLARADWLELKNVRFHNMNRAALHACSSCENIC